ncbi:MAG: hypothetical protein JRH20_16205 [Deltaproteobacteria bacterium]|nr:hypothetical protein [Deltaproteobacteria bacterium]
MILIYGVAGLGLALALVQGIFVLRRALNIRVFAQMVLKLVSVNNLDRALKLCGAVPLVPFAQLVKSGLSSAREEESPENKAQRMEQAYEHHADTLFAPYGRAKTCTFIALGLCLVAALFALASGIQVLYPYGIAGAGILISAYVLKDVLTARHRSNLAYKKIVAALRAAKG